MDNQFVYLSSVMNINLSHNTIDNIQKYSFSDLKELQILDLSHNNIFDDEFLVDLGSVRSLNLSHNQFDSLNVVNVKAIEDIGLHGNPWGCSWLLSQIANEDLGNVHFGSYIGESDRVAGGKYVNAPEDVRCFDYDSDDPLRVKSIERNIVVVRQLVQKKCEESGYAEVIEYYYF